MANILPKTKEIATIEVTMGMKKIDRNRSLPKGIRSSASASASPIAIEAGTLMAHKSRVTRTLLPAAPPENRSIQLSNPTNCGVEMKSQR